MREDDFNFNWYKMKHSTEKFYVLKTTRDKTGRTLNLMTKIFRKIP